MEADPCTDALDAPVASGYTYTSQYDPDIAGEFTECRRLYPKSEKG